MADALAASLLGNSHKAVQEPAGEVDKHALFNLSYGLFVLTARQGDQDNGCIINTAAQVTDTPRRISITVNKANLTHAMVLKTGAFNLSVLSQETPFKLFERFGFASGRDGNKLHGIDFCRTVNGICYIPQSANAVISANVVNTVDLGTHTLFIADVTEAHVLSGAPSVTYAYYFAHIKPKPPILGEQKKGFVCRICGYVYEGDELPGDFICPLCKHGVADFERIG